MVKKIIFSCLVALLAVGGTWWLIHWRGDEQEIEQSERDRRQTEHVQPVQTGRTADKPGTKGTRHKTATHPVAAISDSAERQEGTEEAVADVQGKSGADEEEALVKAFDSLTDSWTKPSGRAISMEEVQRFVERFRKVPKARKSECLQRALNLVPDENVMLLAGVLMDKTQDKEYLEMVYNDVLNRDEDVKQPILQQIFKDREHPCWTDTAWVLDVTGRLPSATKSN